MKNSGPLRTAFVDVVLNLALFLALIMVIMIILIGDKESDKKNDVKVLDTFILTLDWNKDTTYDMDLHIQNPQGNIINFKERDQPWGTLERDDLGTVNDQMNIGGIIYTYRFNREVIHLRNLPSGEYTVNIHFYSRGGENMPNLPQTISIEMIQLEPRYDLVYVKKYDLELSVREEMTAFSFNYNANTGQIILDRVTQKPFIALKYTSQSGVE